MLLDVGLPGEDGFASACWRREKSSRIGIIMATSAADTVDRVVGLETRASSILLKIFAENPNRPLMRDRLLEVTAHCKADAFDRVIDPRITRLRRKVEIDPTHPEAIHMARGVGCMFVPPKD